MGLTNRQNSDGNLDKEEIDDAKYWPQVLAIIIASIGPFSNGILLVWASPFTIVITHDKENYDITEEQASYFTTIPPFGMMFACFLFFKLTDAIGRKKSLFILAIPQITYWIIMMFAKHVYTFYAARLLSGFGDALLFCSVPIYVGEICVPKVRGFWGNAPTFSLFGGQFFITVLGSYFDVKTTAYICIGIPILYVILLTQIPESPYYLIKAGKYEEAKASLTWLRRKANIEKDFGLLKADVDRQMSETGTWKDLFAIKSNRKALIAGIFLRFSQQMSGAAVVFNYTQPIFEKAGGNISPQISSMIIVGLAWILNLFCGISVEKFGRKTSYFYSHLSCGFILVVMAVYFFLEQYNITNLTNFNWLPLAGMVVYMFTISFGIGVVPTLMLGELFSTSIKAKGLCLLVSCFGFGIFFSVTLFHQITALIGLYCPFLFFGVCCFISSFLTLHVVPETKGKTLEEIQQSLKKSSF